MSNNVFESVLGAAVLVVAGWFLIFAYERSDQASGNGYELNARFDKVDGLSIGSDVRMAGIKVGTITAQKLDPITFQAIITFTIQRDIELPADTAAVITAEGLLGGNYLSLLPGGDPETLAPGDELEETQDAVDLIGLLNKFIQSDSE